MHTLPAEKWELKGSVEGRKGSVQQQNNGQSISFLFSLDSSAPEMLPEVVFRPSGIPHLHHTGSRNKTNLKAILL